MRTMITGKGLPPKITQDSVHQWDLLPSTNLFDSVFGGKTLNAINITNTIETPVGKGRDFTGTGYFVEPIGNEGTDAAVFTTGDFTIETLFRVVSPTVTNQIIKYGTGGGSLPIDNILYSLSISSTGKLRHFWEYGSSINQLFDTNFSVVTGRWYHVHSIKRGSNLEVWVGGRLIQTFTNIIAPTGGGNAKWALGAAPNGASPFTGHISYATVQNAAYSEAEIQESRKRVLLAGFPCTNTPKVEVQDSLSNWVDLTNLEGHNWLESVEMQDNANDLCETMSVSLTREIDSLSLAWLKTDSKLNLNSLNLYSSLLRSGGSIRASWAKTPLFLDPVPTDYQLHFEGEIDELDVGRSPISIKCRDKGAELSYIQIEIDAERYPQQLTNQPPSVVMQQIINRWVASAPVIFLPEPSQGTIVPYTLSRGNCHAAIREIAAVEGWDIKYRWDQGAKANKLTYFDVGRDRPDADFLIGASDYWDVSKLSQSRVDIRNKVAVIFADSLDLDSTNNARVKTVLVEDIPSQNKYGLQFCELTEAVTKHIDTTAEALTLANAVLSDLKDPEADQSIEMPFMPEICSHNIGIFQKNGVHYNEDQVFGVVGVTHTWEPQNGARTTIKTRGKPAIGKKKLQFMLSGIMGGIYVPTTAPTELTINDFTINPLVSGLTVRHPELDYFSKWFKSRLFVSTTPGFIPGTTNLVAQGSQKSFTIPNLEAGLVHYLKIEMLDERGNAFEIDLGSVTPLYSGGLDTNPDFSFGRQPLMLNSAMSAFSTKAGTTQTAPDGFGVIGAPEWGIDLGIEVGITSSGSKSLTFATNIAGIQTKKMIVEGGKPYKISAAVYFSIDDPTAQMYLAVTWFDGAKTQINVDIVAAGVGTQLQGAFDNLAGFIDAPLAARFCTISAARDFATYPNPWAFVLDSLDIEEVKTSFSAYANTNFILAAGEQPHNFNIVEHNHGGNYDTVNSVFTAPQAGIYAFSAIGNFTNTGINRTRFAIQKNNIVFKKGTWRDSLSNSMTAHISIDSLFLQAGDQIRISSYATLGRTQSGTQAGFWFTGRQVS